MWSLESGACLKTLKGHSNAVVSVCVAGGKIAKIVSGSEDNSIKVWA